MSHDLPTKSDDETPVPSCWRPSLEAIVRAFVGGDFLLQAPIASVRPPSNEDAAQMREYVEDYGEHLVPLNDDTWLTSVCAWDGAKWDLLVDLRTQAEGRSDLVLRVSVREEMDGYVYEPEMIYVP